MYFHSSGSRRDHYATLRNKHQVFKQQQLQQLQRRSSTSSSIVSGTDSGYQSPPLSPLSRCAANEQHQYGTKLDHHHDSASTASSFVSHSTTSTKKKKRTVTKKHLDHPASRQPDLVYSSPRPLAFPFHNDCHFLPVAEADPRDIARIAPPPPPPAPTYSPSRRISNNSKTASFTSSSYHRTSISSIPEHDTLSHATSDSRPASLISSVRQGTVRSLRSFFQMGEQQQNIHRPTTPDHRLLALEPKTGTVASLRKLFSRPSTSDYADLEAETATHIANNSQSRSRKQERAMPDHTQEQQQQQPVRRFALPRLWSSKSTSAIMDHLPKPPSTPPTAKNTHPPSPSSSSSRLKRFFTRPVSPTAGSSSSTTTNAPSNTLPTPPPRPLFTSFSRTARKDINLQTPSKKQPATTISNDTLTSPPSSAVGRIWKNFKRLVNGKKVSRIGVI